MITPNMQKLLNDQIQAELYSSYLYLGLSVDMDSHGLPGFAHWFRCQYREEMDHAEKIIDFILHVDGSVILRDISASIVKWDTPYDAMTAVLEHEKLITERIRSIMSAARTESDFGSENLMRWFVDEQIQEEQSVKKILHQLGMVGDNKNGLLFIDRELGKRNPCK